MRPGALPGMLQIAETFRFNRTLTLSDFHHPAIAPGTSGSHIQKNGCEDSHLPRLPCPQLVRDPTARANSSSVHHGLLSLLMSSASPSRGLGDRTLGNTRALKVVVLRHWIALFFPLFFPRRARVIYVGMEA